METLEAIRTRRSVRDYTGREVPEEEIREVIEAGRWAPSGLNNQPWRFCVVRDAKTKDLLGKQTRYGAVINSAYCALAVFYDTCSGYDRTKDVLAIGACIQNMLLSAHTLGLGACWLGEILKNRKKVEELLEAPDKYELMAVITLGNVGESPEESGRKEMDELVYRWI